MFKKKLYIAQDETNQYFSIECICTLLLALQNTEKPKESSFSHEGGERSLAFSANRLRSKRAENIRRDGCHILRILLKGLWAIIRPLGSISSFENLTEPNWTDLKTSRQGYTEYANNVPENMRWTQEILGPLVTGRSAVVERIFRPAD